MSSCQLSSQENLLPWISDNVLAIILPTVVYTVAGGFFYVLDQYELFNDYRIHPSEDELKRNHITRWECFKGVVRYHIIQITVGLLLNWNVGPQMVSDEACQIHETAKTLNHTRKIIPRSLNIIGIDAKKLSRAVAGTSSKIAYTIAGDYTTIDGRSSIDNGLLTLSKLCVTILTPILQLLLALIVVDTYFYFTHRLCHVNRTLYRIVHAQHHRIYVSYAWGAVYAHWLETLFLDILSFVLAGEIAQLSPRQSMVFGSAATIKTISDHCGYVFPWDPLRWLNRNGARYHDLHHQSWGLKYNFSTYTVFWDNFLGTAWADKEGAETRYQRVRDLTSKKPLEKEVTGNRGLEKIVAEGGTFKAE
ncbi:MAG: hypothetical protein Q9222_000956 [Ikaeria aurantiellina]